VIIVSRIIHVLVDRRLNVTNKFKNQSRLSSRLAIVMFRGTPCIYHIIYICCTSNTCKLKREKQTFLSKNSGIYFLQEFIILQQREPENCRIGRRL